jgi:hypothetical protein
MIGNDVMFELVDKWEGDLKEKGVVNYSDAMSVIGVILGHTLQRTNSLDVALTELSEFCDYTALGLTRRMKRKKEVCDDSGSSVRNAVRGGE